MENIKLEKPVEYNLKDYGEALHYGDNNSGYITHQALISYPAYKLAEMYRDGIKWNENQWGEIFGETEKAILVSVCNYLYWLPKKLVYKVRKIREIRA